MTSTSAENVKPFTHSTPFNYLIENLQDSFDYPRARPKNAKPPLPGAARLRPSQAGVITIYLHLFARSLYVGGWGERSTGGHEPALVGPVRPYLASLSVFPLSGLSCLPKSRRHVRSRLGKLSRQHRRRTTSGAPSTDPTGNRTSHRTLRTAHFLSATYAAPAFPEIRPPANAFATGCFWEV